MPPRSARAAPWVLAAVLVGRALCAPKLLDDVPADFGDDEVVVYDEPSDAYEPVYDDEDEARPPVRRLRMVSEASAASAAARAPVVARPPPVAPRRDDDKAVMVWDPLNEPIQSNWTHDTVQALVAKTPFLSADGDTVFTGRLESDVVSEADLCDENTAVVCTRRTLESKAPLFGRTTWTLEASDAASGELRWRATTSEVSKTRVHSRAGKG